MAVFNSAKREIDIKIVYYGPALCGKTTNVQCIHQKLAPGQRGEMVSLATKDDRTLFFDFLPIELGNVKGFKTRFHIYTVPGQVYYALTRRAVLTGVDGIIFVADSQSDKMEENIESLQDLEENLQYYRKDITGLPFIIQYNKRDLDNILSVNELDAALNNNLCVPYFEACAVTGKGVMDTLTACCRMVLQKLDDASGKKEGPIIKIFKEPVAEEPNMSAEPAGDTLCEDQEPGTAGEPAIDISNEAFPVTPASDESVLCSLSLEASADSASAEQSGVVNIIEPEENSFLEVPELSINTSRAEPALALAEPVSEDAVEPEQPAVEHDDVSIQVAYEPESGPESIPLNLQAEACIIEPVPSAETRLRITACGQPTVETFTSVKLPVTFKIEPFNTECTLDILIKFDNLIVREPK
jgi:hypothetical protein